MFIFLLPFLTLLRKDCLLRLFSEVLFKSFFSFSSSALMLNILLLGFVLLAGLGFSLFSANCLALRLACKAVLALLRDLLYSLFDTNFMVLVPGTVVE